MSNRCPKCQCENREMARFCAECGSALMGVQGESLIAVAFAEDTAPAGDTDAGPSAEPDVEDCELEAGVLVAGRYYVLEVVFDGLGQPVYQVEDHGVCRACGAVATASAEEPFCTDCGAQLSSTPLPWPVRYLTELPSANDVEGSLTWEGRTFALAPALAPSADADEEMATFSSAEVSDSLLPHSLTYVTGQRSDVGAQRAGRANEDSVFTLTLAAITDSAANLSVGLFIVADGMGGHLDGQVASRTACEVISAELFRSLGLPAAQAAPVDDESIIRCIEQAVQQANQEIYESACANDSNMGTTVVLAQAVNDKLYVASVGDSRAYLWGRDGLRQLTRDHSHVFALKEKGLIEEDEIYTHPRRNEIYRNLGTTQAVEVDCFGATLHPGELLLLCSDGLWEMLHNDGIADVLLISLSDPQAICDELVRRANQAGGEDNISVVVVRTVGQ